MRQISVKEVDGVETNGQTSRDVRVICDVAPRCLRQLTGTAAAAAEAESLAAETPSIRWTGTVALSNKSKTLMPLKLASQMRVHCADLRAHESYVAEPMRRRQ